MASRPAWLCQGGGVLRKHGAGGDRGAMIEPALVNLDTVAQC
ncbi:hypothetical protein [Leptolyngbya sp. KIOST-1]|nr:hypothetical protein [Leptolyngbya sp. KIOST-1]